MRTIRNLSFVLLSALFLLVSRVTLKAGECDVQATAASCDSSYDDCENNYNPPDCDEGCYEYNCLEGNNGQDCGASCWGSLAGDVSCNADWSCDGYRATATCYCHDMPN